MQILWDGIIIQTHGLSLSFYQKLKWETKDMFEGNLYIYKGNMFQKFSSLGSGVKFHRQYSSTEFGFLYYGIIFLFLGPMLFG